MSDNGERPLSPKARATIAALDYASPSLRQPTDLVAAAEQAIDRGRSIRDVARHLGKPSRAATYLRRSLTRRHAIATAGDACVGCGTATSGVIGVRWSFVVPTRFLRGILGETPAADSVETYHAMCGDCAMRPFRRQRRVARFARLAAVGIAAGLAILLAGLYWFWSGKGEGVARVILGTGATAMLASLAGTWAAKRIVGGAVPRTLRRAMPRWLRFEAWQAWFDRPTP